MLAKPFLEKNDLGAGHTERVLHVAETDLKIPAEIKELVMASGVLHDIGGSSIKEQYEKGPAIARKLLIQLGYSEAFTNTVCEIVGTHHERFESPSKAFQLLFDADQIVRFSKEEFAYYEAKGTRWDVLIRKMYSSRARIIARRMLHQRKSEVSAESA
jgi:hypothetical protein